jgi:hypothetical protein
MVRKPSAQADDNEPVPAAPLMQCVTLCQYFNSFLFVVGGAGNTITTTTIKMSVHQQNSAGQSAATVTATGAPAEV